MKFNSYNQIPKRLLVALTIVLSATAASFHAFAANGDKFKVGDLIYSVKDESAGTAVVEGPIDSPNAISSYKGTLSSTTITIPETVTYNSKSYTVVGNALYCTWNDSKVTTVNINSSSFTINTDNDYAFLIDCDNLSKISVTSSNPYLTTDANGLLYNKDKTVLIKFPTSKTSVSIPTTVKTIYYAAFRKAQISTISIPSSVITLGVESFYGCPNITTVSIPGGIETIPFNAFANCVKLKTVTLSEGLKSIGGHAFSGSVITTLELPKTVTSVSLNGCNNLTTVKSYNNKPVSDLSYPKYNKTLYVPTGTTNLYKETGNLGAQASSVIELGLTIVPASTGDNNIEQGETKTLPLSISASSVTTYSSFEFEIELPDGLTLQNVTSRTLSSFSFNHSKTDYYANKYKITGTSSASSSTKPAFLDLTISASDNATEGSYYIYFNNIKVGTQNLNNSAIAYTINKGTKIESIKLSESKIDMCPDEEHKLSITISPEKASSLPVKWVSSNSNIVTVDNSGTVRAKAIGNANITVSSADDSSVKATCTVYVNKKEPLTYSYNSTTFTATVTGVTIGQTASSYTIPETVTYRGQNYRVTAIGKNAFEDNFDLTDINIPNTVTEIGDNAFDNCDYLKDIVIPSSVTKIGQYAFNDCDRLTSVVILGPVTAIGSAAFSDCAKITSVYYVSNNPIQINSNTFAHQVYEGASLYVSKTALSKIQATASWSSFKKIIGRQFVTGIEAEGTVYTYTGKNMQLIAKPIPEDADKQTLRWTSSNSNVVYINSSGVLTAKAVGKATVTVETYDITNITKEIEVTVTTPKLGDVNLNGEITLPDAILIANYAIGNDVGEFYEDPADVNGDNDITISDASGTVTLVLAQPKKSAPARVRGFEESATQRDCLVISDFNAREGKTATVSVGLDNTVNYCALQADIIVPEGTSLENITAGARAEGHTLSSRKIEDNIYRVIIYDLGLSEFATNDGSLFNLSFAVDDADAGDIIINNIIASDSRGNEYYLDAIGGHNNGLTGLDRVSSDNISISAESCSIIVNNANGLNIVIYTADGRTVRNAVAGSDVETYSVAPGLYIVAVGNRVAKIVIK